MDKPYGINPLPIIPIRKEPSHRSEMVSQLLFGETFSISYVSDDWAKITASYDNYIGFVDFKQIYPLSEIEFNALNHDKWGTTNAPISVIIKNDSQNGTIIPAGSKLPLNGKISFGKTSFNYSPSLVCSPNIAEKGEFIRDEIIKSALKFIYAPYLWGGKSCLGLDCSGFSQTIFKINGIQLLRDASEQSTQGNNIGFIDEAKSGDLLFFGLPEQSITHVGIYMGEGFIIHASGVVRIDTIDHFGIFDNQTQTYTHQLRVIKDVISKINI